MGSRDFGELRFIGRCNLRGEDACLSLSPSVCAYIDKIVLSSEANASFGGKRRCPRFTDSRCFCVVCPHESINGTWPR